MQINFYCTSERPVVGCTDCRFHDVSGSHLQSQVDFVSLIIGLIGQLSCDFIGCKGSLKVIAGSVSIRLFLVSFLLVYCYQIVIVSVHSIVCLLKLFVSTCNIGCGNALGMEDGAIFDGQISASSYIANHAGPRGRLNFQVAQGKIRSWTARKRNANQWLQVDLGTKHPNVSGVATQGGTDNKNRARWVRRYKLQYSDDGVNFRYYREQGQTSDKVRWVSSTRQIWNDKLILSRIS